MSFEFTKENIDLYLKALAKEYRRLIGKAMPAELILIGGASVLINYGFRNMTTDIDALIHGASAMKDAIRHVGDMYRLPNGWLNADFIRTESYSPQIETHSIYYKTYSNVLTIRTVSAEYLIAMKLKSGRQYKSDLSDVLGILAEHEKQGVSIAIEQIQKASVDLYGAWEVIPEPSRSFIHNVMKNGHFETLYEQILVDEAETKRLLKGFESDYPHIMNEKNADSIAEDLQKKADRASVMAELRKRKTEQAEKQE